MISSVRGRVETVGLDHAVIETGGIGFAVLASPRTLADLRVGSESRVSTTLVVREDSLTLYGFADDDEREVFGVLQTVTGVGPRLALAVLAVLTPEDLRRAIASEDLGALQRVPGIGKKVASRLVLELAGKLGAPAADGEASAPESGGGAVDEEVVAALVQLGWNAREAADAVAAVGGSNRAETLRAALQYLAVGRG